MEQISGVTPITLKVVGKSKVVFSITGFTKIVANENISGKSRLAKKIVGLSKIDLEDR